MGPGGYCKMPKNYQETIILLYTPIMVYQGAIVSVGIHFNEGMKFPIPLYIVIITSTQVGSL